MSALNNWMTERLGSNWRTTLSGWASALLGLSTVASLIGDAKIAAAVLAILTAGSRILQGIVAADAAPQPDAKSGQAMPATMAAMALAACILMICTGCAITAVVNVGGTVNVVPVAKVNGSGCMSSETDAREENPSTTTVKIPLPGGPP